MASAQTTIINSSNIKIRYSGGQAEVTPSEICIEGVPSPRVLIQSHAALLIIVYPSSPNADMCTESNINKATWTQIQQAIPCIKNQESKDMFYLCAVPQDWSIKRTILQPSQHHAVFTSPSPPLFSPSKIWVSCAYSPHLERKTSK